jgi:hypothetical protein
MKIPCEGVLLLKRRQYDGEIRFDDERYRISKGSLWNTVINRFRKFSGFVQAHIYRYESGCNPIRKENKIGYFDRYKSELNV